MPDVVIGVDVSKRWLDVSLAGGRARRVEMEAGALAALAAEAQERGALVVFEATGAYDAPLREALEAADVAYARVNPAQARPAQARAFAQGCGILGKTDAVDARVLAEMGARLDLSPTEPLAPARRALRSLAVRRRQLVEMRKQELARRDGLGPSPMQASIERHIAWLDGEVAALDSDIAALTAADPEISACARLLRSAPGVGPVVAAALLADCPELGKLGRRQLAKIAGLAPLARDSGQYKGARAIRGGRPDLRARLYNAAFSACRCDPEFKALRTRLTAEGKPFKAIIITAAHKLLRRLNAMIKSGQPYAPQPSP